MKQLSLDALRTLVTIIDQGGFAKTAEMLNRSQPAISLQIKKLEQQLDRPLFRKQGQRSVPNQDGQWLYQKAKSLLAMNDEIFAQFTDDTPSGHVRLGIPSEFASRLLPSLLSEFSQNYPDVSLEVTSQLSQSLLSADIRHRYDVILALMTEPTEVSASKVIKDRMVWVAASDFEFKRASIPLVLAAEGCVYRSRVIDRLKQQTTPWRITYTNSDLGGLTAAMQQGLGISAMSKRSVPKELKILRHPLLPDLGEVSIGLFKSNHEQYQTAASGAVSSLYQFMVSRLMAGT